MTEIFQVWSLETSISNCHGNLGFSATSGWFWYTIKFASCCTVCWQSPAPVLWAALWIFSLKCLFWQVQWVQAVLSRYIFFDGSNHPCSYSTMWWSFWTEFEGLTQILEQMNVKGGKWESEQETADFRGSSSLQCGPQQPGAPRKSG